MLWTSNLYLVPENLIYTVLQIRRGLAETVLMRGHKICFHCDIRKINFELSSIPLLIWSSDLHPIFLESI